MAFFAYRFINVAELITALLTTYSDTGSAHQAGNQVAPKKETIVKSSHRKKRPNCHNLVVEWLKKMDWQERPTVEGDMSTTEFRFAAGGKYGLNCLLLAQAEIQMITLNAWPDFGVPKNKEKKVLKYCAEHSVGHGIFTITSGKLVFIHAVSLDEVPSNGDAISDLIDHMDQAVTEIAEGVVEIINGGK